MILSIGVIVLLMGILIAIFTVITKQLRSKISPNALKLVLLLKAKLMYNSILRYTLQSFYRISLATFMNLKLIFTASVSLSALFFSIPITISLIGFTFFTYAFMQKNKDKLEDPYFEKCYGSLFAKVETYKHK